MIGTWLNNPEAFWLNVTNALLGLATLVFLALLAGSIVIEIVRSRSHRRRTVH